MRFIYKSASKVLVWLREEMEDSRTAMEAILRHLYSKEIKRHDPEVRRLWQRPYWSRLDIIQEVCVACQLELCCGSASLSRGILEHSAGNDCNRMPPRPTFQGLFRHRITKSGTNLIRPSNIRPGDIVAGDLRAASGGEPALLILFRPGNETISAIGRALMYFAGHDHGDYSGGESPMSI